MEENVISKKDLLQLTGITYGQLYRWKRKKLIPEEWFIKRSSYTGQETYFPKDKILERVEKILSMKDDFSLDELADTFSPTLKVKTLTKTFIIEQNIVSSNVVDMYQEFFSENVTNCTVVGLLLCEEYLKKGIISLDDGKQILSLLQKHESNIADKNFRVAFYRKFGVGIAVLMEENKEIYFDENAVLVIDTTIQKYVEMINKNMESRDE